MTSQLSRKLAILGCAVVAACAVGVSGCSNEIHRERWDDLTAADRAKAITKYRKLAVEQLGLYESSGYEDVEALELAVQYERVTTRVSPGGCPSCFREYGKSLSILGHHYRVIYEQVLEDLDVASGADERALREEAEYYRELMVTNFRESNKAYRIYFANPDTPVINPREFERVMRHHEYLGEYDMAALYLERLSSVALVGVSDSEDRAAIQKNVETLRQFYERKLQTQRERTYREDLPDEEFGPARSRRGRR